jgi:hypothetical protein
MGTDRKFPFLGVKFICKMRKTIIVIALSISLMSTKGAEKPANIVFDNKSDRNIVFSSIKNTDTLKSVILEKSYLDPRCKYFKRNSINTDTLTRADLYYYLSKDKAFYAFYFLRVIRFDTLTNNYFFENIYDSINIDIYKEKIHIGDKGYNTFIYTNKKIVFKSYDR